MGLVHNKTEKNPHDIDINNQLLIFRVLATCIQVCPKTKFYDTTWAARTCSAIEFFGLDPDKKVMF